MTETRNIHFSTLRIVHTRDFCELFLHSNAISIEKILLPKIGSDKYLFFRLCKHHLRSFCITLALATLGWVTDTNEITSRSWVMLPKVAKASAVLFTTCLHKKYKVLIGAWRENYYVISILIWQRCTKCHAMTFNKMDCRLTLCNNIRFSLLLAVTKCLYAISC